MKSKLNKKILNTINKYKTIIEADGIPVKAIYVFGSRARGTQHKGSDLDTCIVSSKFGKDPLKEMARLYYLASDVDDYIEPHPLSPKDFDNEADYFAREIKRTGIRVV